jgi:polyvinyl alcohol dehydrogenase (cytochrome)
MYGFSAQGPVSVANGLVYGCSLSPEGPMVAMNAATGDIKWKRDSGASCLGGAAIGDGTVYWGTGYRTFAPITSAGDRMYALTPNGR